MATSIMELRFSFVVVVIASIFTVCTPVPVSDNEGELIQVTLLSESSAPNDRYRRDADTNLPDTLEFGVPVKGDNVVLRLRRSNLLPTVTSDPESTEKVNSFIGNSGVYTDASRRSAMIVRRDANEYSLSGRFLHGNSEWDLEGLADQDAIDGVLHRLRPTSEGINFEGDVVYDNDGDDRGIIDIKGINSVHRRKRNSDQNYTSASSILDRHRRSGPIQHVVEIAFIADNEALQKFVPFYGTALTLVRMREWYSYVAESIRIRYEGIDDPDIAITIQGRILKILTNEVDDNFIEDLIEGDGKFDGDAGLAALEIWAQAQADIPVSDHYMLFTGFKIRGAVGIANSGEVCTRSGVSITEEDLSGFTSGIAAHELGHSLSAEHDALEAGCSDDDQFVMATTLSLPMRDGNEGANWKFSACSIVKFKQYLSSVTCTLPGNTNVEALPAPPAFIGAGQELDRDKQCKLAFNNQSSFFCQDEQGSGADFARLCGGMLCADNEGLCSTVLPQEYTDCGTNKWCVAGLCVSRLTSTTTTAPTTTPPTTPTTAAPTAPPTMRPTTTRTTAAPTAPPTMRPTTSRTTAAPTAPPTMRPTTTPMTPYPTLTPTPTTAPTAAPTAAPEAPSTTVSTDFSPTRFSDCGYLFFQDLFGWIRCIKLVKLHLIREHRRRHRNRHRNKWTW